MIGLLGWEIQRNTAISEMYHRYWRSANWSKLQASVLYKYQAPKVLTQQPIAELDFLNQQGLYPEANLPSSQRMRRHIHLRVTASCSRAPHFRETVPCERSKGNPFLTPSVEGWVSRGCK